MVMRNFGVQGINEVTWGTHVCNLFFSKEELLKTLVSYLKTGILNNEACVYISGPTLNPLELVQALQNEIPNFEECVESEQLEIIPYDEWYLRNDVIDIQEILNGWFKKLRNVLSRGFSGLRSNGGTEWIEPHQWPLMLEYERQIDKIIHHYPILAMCNYFFQNTEASVTVDAILTHELTHVAKSGNVSPYLINRSGKAMIANELEKNIAELKSGLRLAAHPDQRVTQIRKEIERLRNLFRETVE